MNDEIVPFIQTLKIKNYKCISNAEVNFQVPKGNQGSGLNLIIGNNGTGKTSVLESIDYLFGGKYKAESRLKYEHFNNIEDPIKIEARTSRFRVQSELQFYKEKFFHCFGYEFEAKPRERKAPRKVFSVPISAGSKFVLDENCYYDSEDTPYRRKTDGQTPPVDPRELTFDGGRIHPEHLEHFYFDRQRNRHLKQGTYKTTLDKICEDLLWKFQRNGERDTTIKSIFSLSDQLVNDSNKKLGEKLASDFSEFFTDNRLGNLRLELLDAKNPFSSGFFALRVEDENIQIKSSEFGSGEELILSLLLLKSISDQDKSKKLYLIDEPETHLHPNAQQKLAEFLAKLAIDNQVIISTHSPYIVQILGQIANISIFHRDEMGHINVEQLSQNNSIFEFGPTFNEVNYKAFNLATKDFHNELYGELLVRTNNSTVGGLEDWLKKQGHEQGHTWKRDDAKSAKNVTLHSRVRNSYHHTENKCNDQITPEELEASIKGLIEILERLK